MASSARRPTFQSDDFKRLGLFGVGFLLTNLAPARLDAQCARLIFRSSAPFRRQARRELAATMQRTLGLKRFDEAFRISNEHYQMAAELQWGRFRALRSNGWLPKIELQGLDRVQRALDRGRGVILWMMSFCANPIIFQAFRRAGVPLIHLSEARHGAPSDSRLALRSLAPLYRRAEDPYLAERIVIPRDQSLGYMRTLLARLGQNRCVSIGGERPSRQSVQATLFNRSFEFASGAPALAWRTGAVLFTTYAIRESAFQYRVIIEEPIQVERALVRRESVERAVGQFARRLERHIARHPANWQGWMRVLLRATSTP